MSVQQKTVVRSFSSSLLQSVILTILFAAIGVSLPVVFHLLGIAAISFSPMHFPVLLASMLLGPISGIIVGISSVLFSMLFTGMPVLFPTGIAMLFELAAYGLVVSLAQKKLFAHKQTYTVFLASLIIAMIAGRAVHGLVQFTLTLFSSSEYSFMKFLNSCFVVTYPGILLQLTLLPIIAFIVSKTEFLADKRK